MHGPCIGVWTHSIPSMYVSHQLLRHVICHIQIFGALLCFGSTSETLLYLTFIWWLILAPPSSNMTTISLWPLSDDIISGVSPPFYIWKRDKTWSYITFCSCMCIHFTPSLTLTPPYSTVFPSIPLSVVPDLPLPGLTVSPPHCDHGMMPSRLLSCPTSRGIRLVKSWD